MSLTELWVNSRQQLEGKTIQQIIAFAGEGHLRDRSVASEEFRTLLSHVPSSLLNDYVTQCLEDSFPNSGMALQDLINQLGRRLGFAVIDGRYRGASGQIGMDGLWTLPDGHTVIVEVKTTNAYQIPLDTLAKYRRELITQGRCTEDESSMLIILGRSDRDTTDLEAQIRGSRHAWSIRLISVDALTRLVGIKETVDDPQIINRIARLLIPREYTKLDDIVDLVFSTAEDVREDAPAKEEVLTEDVSEAPPPVAFHTNCVQRIQSHIKVDFVKRTRTIYSSPDDSTRLSLALSRAYDPDEQTYYWFAFHEHHRAFLKEANTGYVALGCGSEHRVLLIPFDAFGGWLDDMNTTEGEKRFYWHVRVMEDEGRLILQRKRGTARIDLTSYLI